MSQLTSIGPDLPLPRSQAYRDWLGVGASVLCAIHCAAMPFVVGFLPLLGLSFLADPSFHQWMVAICLALALLAFVPGWRRHHRLAPAIIGMAGLGLITFAAFAGPDDCCPTPCDASTNSTDAATMTVAAANPIASPVACAATCCDTATTDEKRPSTVSTVAGIDSGGVGDEKACAASCCSSTPAPKIASGPAMSCAASCCDATPTSTATAIIANRPAPEGDDAASCTSSCCPEEGEVVTAGTSDFMVLVWLWMTPIGGFVLVVAHLTNHRLSAHCKRACCTTTVPSTDAS